MSQTESIAATLPQTTITFIGAGNMARSLIIGLLADGNTHLKLRVADPEQVQLDAIRAHWQDVVTTTDNAEAVRDADVVVLAVKPQIMGDVAQVLAGAMQVSKPLVISVAAGVREGALQDWLGGNLPVVRCMPNTPALVQAGATGLYANALVSPDQRNLAERILRAVGTTAWFEDEAQLDAVTAVSGSGPAYFFAVMEAMQEAAESLGLPAHEADLLVRQTAFGAAKLALESKETPAELRAKVTSKGGTTEAALNALHDGGLSELFSKALNAAAKRSQELGG